MEVSCSIISFRIDVDFPGSDVDMVFKEMGARGVRTPVPSILCDPSQIEVDKEKLPKTPTEASVEFALQWLAGYVDRNEMCIQEDKWEKDYSAKPIKAVTEDGMEYTTWPKVKTELEKIGIEVTSTYSLMMGTCHLICEAPFERFNKELVVKAQKVVQKVFNEFVQYYD